jgi:hypothetical protein
MSGETRPAQERRAIDTTVAHNARVHDYWLGGKDNRLTADPLRCQRVAHWPGWLLAGTAGSAWAGLVAAWRPDGHGLCSKSGEPQRPGRHASHPTWAGVSPMSRCVSRDRLAALAAVAPPSPARTRDRIGRIASRQATAKGAH